MGFSDVELTYPEVGATKGPLLPGGYQHVHATAVIGHGRARFDEAADAVLHWGMQRGAGVLVKAEHDAATVGGEVTVGVWPLRAPCRVVYLVDETDRCGFAYGTLPGHPESGEELFVVRYDPSDGTVHAEVTAFARHATWWSRLGGPVTRLVQRIITRRYLKAV
jgi:uncharacterized protein (UPF0548 family)